MASQNVAERLQLEKGHHDLKIGKSFNKSSKDSFHTVRYDFKPASVDTNQESSLVIGDDSGVEVTVPHVQGAGTTHTVYKGNKRSLQKECVLIINRETGEISLEKLSYAIHLKKTRSDPSVRMTINPRPLTPIEKSKNSPLGRAPVKPHPSVSSSSAPSSQHNAPPIAHKPLSTTHLTSPDDIFGAELGAADMDMSSSSSSDSSSGSGSSDSDSDDEKDTNSNIAGISHQENKRMEHYSTNASNPPSFLHTLSQDLRLSESSDDSD